MYSFHVFWAKYMINVCAFRFSGIDRPPRTPKGLFGMGIFPQLTQQFSVWKLTWSLERSCQLQLNKEQTVFVLNISIPCFLNIYVCSMVRCDACCWMPFFHNQRPMSSQLLSLDSWAVMFVAGTPIFSGLPKPCNSGWILCWVLWREPYYFSKNPLLQCFGKIQQAPAFCFQLNLNIWKFWRVLFFGVIFTGFWRKKTCEYRWLSYRSYTSCFQYVFSNSWTRGQHFLAGGFKYVFNVQPYLGMIS